MAPVEKFIQDGLLQGQVGASTEFTVNSQVVKWTLDNSRDLIFIAVHQKMLRLAYVQPLVDQVAVTFSSVFDELDGMNGADKIEFQQDFELLYQQHLQSSRRSAPTTMTLLPESQSRESSCIDIVAPTTKKSKNKKQRKWDGQTNGKDAKSLDYSAADSEPNQSAEPVPVNVPSNRNKGKPYEIKEVDDVPAKTDDAKFTIMSGWNSLLQNITGQQKIAEKDLEVVIKSMKEHLIQKNVATEIADKLCESVAKSLVGTSVGAFSSIAKIVKASLETSVRQILTPRTSTDLLAEVKHTQRQGRPFVMTFIGVNGVGKSTNLSKTCFWLLQNNFKVLIAACDTFRSGAVEQLKVHAKNLKALDSTVHIEIYDRGYGKDPAAIAQEAIAHAKKIGFDIVMVDTAGRMQDNEPLMRALAKLVTVNMPDKIIFVGEALVGNEAVDQVTKFNQALRDFSGLQNPRQIDGIILTKFDTVDDKVGAALSMTYATGQPILFVGTGQTYTDLKKMNIGRIVDTLLSK